MRLFCVFMTAMALCAVAQAGDYLIVSALVPAHVEAREKAFLPWITGDQRGDEWRRLSSHNIPVYNEHKAGGLSRSIYIPNPGTGYWSLDNLSEEELWETEGRKLKIGDELVSATTYTNEHGEHVYWALWAPKSKSHLIKDKMRELGIEPAQICTGVVCEVEDETMGPMGRMGLMGLIGEAAQ